MRSQLPAIAIAAVLALAVGGCRTVTVCPRLHGPDGPVDKGWVSTRLYFGLSSSDGSGVSEQEWNAFLDETVSPFFPDGLTVLRGHGQYRTHNGEIVAEESRVLVLVHSAGDGDEVAIRKIIEAYKDRFGQESVLRVDTPVRVAF